MTEEEFLYTETYDSRCPVDSSQVVHKVTYRRRTCSRVEDELIEDFSCSRSSTCIKCQNNYL